jgi:hypothetical protein
MQKSSAVYPLLPGINQVTISAFLVLADRWPIADQMHAAVNIPNTFVVYPGVAHTISADMPSDLLAFFETHKPSSAGLNPSIPLLLLGDP